MNNDEKIVTGTRTSDYSSEVIKYYEDRSNVESLNETDKSVSTRLVGAPACGKKIVTGTRTAGYSSEVIKYYEDRSNVGSLDETDKSVGTGLVGAPACGDVMKLQIKVNDHGIIEDAKFKTFGCGSAIASSALVTEWIKSQSLSDAEQIKNSQIAEHLALLPIKMHCSMLAEEAIQAAIKDYKSKQNQT